MYSLFSLSIIIIIVHVFLAFLKPDHKNNPFSAHVFMQKLKYGTVKHRWITVVILKCTCLKEYLKKVSSLFYYAKGYGRE